MLATLNKWGNSEAIRIPKIIAETLGIHCGDKVELIIENESLIIKKHDLKGRELVASLLKDFKINDIQLTDKPEDGDLVGEEEWDYEEDK